MKILRWLLSHSLLILLIVVVIYGYMFWGNLLGKDTPAGKAIAYLSDEFVVVEEFVNGVKLKQAKLAGKTVDATASTDSAAAMNSAATVSSEAVSADEVSADDSQIATDAKSSDDSQMNTSSTGFVEGREPAVNAQNDGDLLAKPSDLNASLTDSQGNQPLAVQESEGSESVVAQDEANKQQMFVPAEIEEQLDNVDGQGKVINQVATDNAVVDQETTEVDVKASWINARKSFYQRNYALSEQSYQEVIDNTDDNFDAYGELGNVYFNQGKKQQAATAYFEAAAILVSKGQMDRASSMVGLLTLLDKEKANQLQQLLDSKAS